MTDNETTEQKQPETCYLVSNDLMQMIMGCLGEMKLKDTGGLYVQLLQTPQIETERLQHALDSIQQSNSDDD